MSNKRHQIFNPRDIPLMLFLLVVVLSVIFVPAYLSHQNQDNTERPDIEYLSTTENNSEIKKYEEEKTIENDQSNTNKADTNKTISVQETPKSNSISSGQENISETNIQSDVTNEELYTNSTLPLTNSSEENQTEIVKESKYEIVDDLSDGIQVASIQPSKIAEATILDNGYYKYTDDVIDVEFGDRVDQLDIITYQAPAYIDYTGDILNTFSGWYQQLMNSNMQTIKFVFNDNIASDESMPSLVIGKSSSVWEKITGFFAGNSIDEDISLYNDGKTDVIKYETGNDNIDIQYRIRPQSGLKEDIVIQQNDNLKNSFVFDMQLEEGMKFQKNKELKVDASQNIYYFTDKYDRYVAHFLPLVAYDANNNGTSDIEMVILPTSVLDTYQIKIIVDEEWLYSEDRVFPITIDPSIVHDTQIEFDSAKSLNRISTTSDPSIELSGPPYDDYGVYTSEVLDMGTSNPQLSSLSWTENGVQTGDGEIDLTTNGLVAKWNFNETSGTSVSDASGNGHTGTLINMTTTGQDASVNSGWTANNKKWGAGALMFDGSDDRVEIPDSALLDTTSNVTISAWIKPDYSQSHSIISKSWCEGFQFGYTLAIYPDNTVEWVWDNNGQCGDGVSAYRTSSTFDIGKWNNITIVHTTSSVKIYINGILASGSKTIGSYSNILNSNQPVRLGAYRNLNGSYSYYDGLMDSVRIFNRALPENEIVSLYNATNIELQTRTGSDANPYDGGWEEWKPTGSINLSLPVGPAGCSTGEYVIVDNTSGSESLTDYQVNFNLDYKSGMSSDFSNIRFTNQSGTDLDYWIESYTASDKADVWVKVDSISANDKEYIALWYDGCTGGNASNADNTFELYDDFLGTSIDTNKWHVYGTQASVSGGNLVMGSGGDVHIASKSTFQQNVITEVYTYQPSFSTSFKRNTPIGLVEDYTASAWFPGSGMYFWGDTQTTTTISVYDSYNSLFSPVLTPANTWYDMAIAYTDFGNKFYINNNVVASSATVSANPALHAYIGNYTLPTFQVDYIKIRKFAVSEPSVYLYQTLNEGFDSQYLYSTTESGLSNYWPMDEISGTNVDDPINNNDGTVTNSKIVDGKFGKARAFDGSSTTLNLNSYSASSVNSISMWIKPAVNINSSTSCQYLTDLRYGGVGDYFYISLGSCTSTLSNEVITINHDSPGRTAVANITLNANEWYKLDFNWNGSVYDIYINSRAQSLIHGTSTSTSAPLLTNPNQIRLGDYWGGGYYFDGIMDEFRLFDANRSAADITNEYIEGIELNSISPCIKQESDSNLKTEGSFSSKTTFGQSKVDQNTVALWHLDETGGSGAYIKDASGNGNNGTPSGTTSVDGKIGKARSFNGAGDYIEASNANTNFAYNQDFSVGLWIKIPTNQVNTAVTVNEVINPWSGTGGYPFILRYINQTEGNSFYRHKISFARYDGSNNPSVLSTMTFNDNQYHYINFVKNGSSLQLYVDGVLDATATDTTTGNTTTSSNLYIGKRGGNTASAYYFTGSIDELKIDNAARTANEIAESYRLGRDHYTNNSISSTDLSDSSKLAFYTASDQPGENYDLIIGESEYVNYQPDSNTKLLLYLEEDLENVLDSSGMANDGALGGGTSIYMPTFTNGYLGKGYDLDGSDDYIQIPSSSGLDYQDSDYFTIDTWLEWDGSGQSRQYIFENRGASGQDYYLLFLDTGSALKAVASTSGGETICSAGRLPDSNSWNHVVAGFDKVNNNIKIYIDGRQYNSCSWSDDASGSSSGAKYIGNTNTNTTNYHFDGVIDEFRISNTIRTSEEIRQTYEIGLRTHSITLDFAASLDNANTISGSGDTSFTVDATTKGLASKGTGLYVGDTIIIKENYNGTEYIAQGIVDAVNSTTGATTVASWKAGSTFPPSVSFTQYANVFKWQREYFDLTGILDDHLETTQLVTIRKRGGENGSTIWLDDMNSVDNYMTDPAGSLINSTDNQYFQYRAILNTNNNSITPSLSDVTINYGGAPEPAVTGITSVAGDASSPYEDISDDSQTLVVFATENSPTNVKWDVVDTDYDSMSNSCSSTTQCLLDLSGNGVKTVYFRAIDGSSNKSSTSYTLEYSISDINLPAVSSITSVASDLSVPYTDVSDNGSTLVVFEAQNNATNVKWDTSDIDYESMSGDCNSFAECDLTLAGEGAKTVYLRATDGSNKSDTSYQLDYTINTTKVSNTMSSSFAGERDVTITVTFVPSFLTPITDGSIKLIMADEFDFTGLTINDVEASGGDVTWTNDEIIYAGGTQIALNKPWFVDIAKAQGENSIVFNFTGDIDSSDGEITFVISGLGTPSNPPTEGSYSYIVEWYELNNAGGSPLYIQDGKININTGTTVTASVPTSFTFIIDPVGSGTVNGANITTSTVTGNAVNFGTFTSADDRIASHDLIVSTNSSNGYVITTQYSGTFQSAGGDTLNDFTGSNTLPTAWSTPPSSGTESYFGYTTDDSSLLSSSTDRFVSSGGNKWASFTTSPSEVAYSDITVEDEITRVGYRLEITNLQPAGVYTTNVMYIATPTF